MREVDGTFALNVPKSEPEPIRATRLTATVTNATVQRRRVYWNFRAIRLVRTCYSGSTEIYHTLERELPVRRTYHMSEMGPISTEPVKTFPAMNFRLVQNAEAALVNFPH